MKRWLKLLAVSLVVVAVLVVGITSIAFVDGPQTGNGDCVQTTDQLRDGTCQTGPNTGGDQIKDQIRLQLRDGSCLTR